MCNLVPKCISRLDTFRAINHTMPMESINTATSGLIETHDEHDPDDIDRILEEADAAFAD